MVAAVRATRPSSIGSPLAAIVARLGTVHDSIDNVLARGRTLNQISGIGYVGNATRIFFAIRARRGGWSGDIRAEWWAQR